MPARVPLSRGRSSRSDESYRSSGSAFGVLERCLTGTSQPRPTVQGMERPLPHSNPIDRFAVGDLLKPTEVAPRRGDSHTRLYAAAEDSRIRRRAVSAIGTDRCASFPRTSTRGWRRHRPRDEARMPRLPTGFARPHGGGPRVSGPAGRRHGPRPRRVSTPATCTGARPSPPGRTRDRRTRTADGGGGSLPATRAPRGSTRDWPSIARDRGPDVSRRSGHSRRPSRWRDACAAADAAIPTPS